MSSTPDPADAMIGRRRWLAIFAALGTMVAFGASGSSAQLSTAGGAVAKVSPEGDAVALPGCSSAVGAQHRLAHVGTAMLPLSGQPFGVVASYDGKWWFVSQYPDEVLVISGRGASPRIVRGIPLTAPAAGEALSPDGRLLLVAEGGGAAVVSVARAVDGTRPAVLGELAAPQPPSAQTYAIEVAVSRDGRFVFVSLEYANEIAVFNLRDAFEHGFRSSAFVGRIPLGLGVVGIAVSPDGRWLYATSEATRSNPRQGTVSVIDVRKAEVDPHRSVVASALAGCQPVRVAVSPDGAVVWVTARGSNSLLAFSAARLRRRPAAALLASLRVGPAPVGLAILPGGSRIVVADSNRFAPNQNGQLTVVETRAALAHKPTFLGSIRAGLFPREVAVVPHQRRLLVTNFYSKELEIIDTTHVTSQLIFASP